MIFFYRINDTIYKNIIFIELTENTYIFPFYTYDIIISINLYFIYYFINLKYIIII